MTGVDRTVDEEFLPLVEQCRKMFDELWALPLDKFKMGWATAPPALHSETPSISDILVSHKLVPVTDGSTVEIQIYSPKGQGSTPPPLLFVTHGGGWVVGTHAIEEVMNRSICVKNGCVVVSVDYRMAPEYPFPYAVNDSWDVLNWCQKHASELNIDPRRIILAGASAGGNLATVLAIRARNEGMDGILGQVLNIPVTCHPKLFPQEQYSYSSWEENKDAPIVDATRMQWFWDQYLPEADRNEYHSPLIAESLVNLPPALIQVAGMDPLRDEGLAYAEALKKAGVHVDLHVFPGLPHGFAMYPQISTVAVYHQNSVDWVKRRIQ